MYYTVIKHSGHLRTLEKCRKHSPAARVFYISLVFSNVRRVLSQCNTRLRFLYLLTIFKFNIITTSLSRLLSLLSLVFPHMKLADETKKKQQRKNNNCPINRHSWQPCIVKCVAERDQVALFHILPHPLFLVVFLNSPDIFLSVFQILCSISS